MSENKVNGPEDAVVSDTSKRLPQEKIFTTTRCSQERSTELDVAPSSWRIVTLVFLRKPDAAPMKGTRSDRAIAFTSVMSKWHAACAILRLEREEESEGWKQLRVGGIDGISCQHLHMMMTQLLQTTWEWQEDRRKEHVARQKKETHDVLGQHGHEDGLRRGRTKAQCETYGWSRRSRMIYSGIIT